MKPSLRLPPRRASFVASCLFVSVAAVQAASQAPVAAQNGMVVTAQQLATHVGVDVLKDGGNAIDAAVAVGYGRRAGQPSADTPRRSDRAGLLVS